jgi:hypothetical protein
VDAVVIPVGGAGLIAGAALALKTLNPHVAVIGAEPATVPSLSAALDAGRPVDVKAGATLADGLLVPRVGTNAFALARKHVDKVRPRRRRGRGGQLRSSCRRLLVPSVLHSFLPAGADVPADGHRLREGDRALHPAPLRDGEARQRG